jgi:NADH-quinone oxidoreductase subunit J
MQFLHSTLCLLLILSGLMVAFSANPVESVLFLILTFFNAGAILFMFNAEFLGLVFIIVYVGAIAVLFLFVVMMLNVKIHESIFSKLFNKNFSNSIIAFLLIYIVSIVLFIYLSSIFSSHDIAVNLNNGALLFDSLNNIDVLGQVLYNYYLICFLIAGLILLVALIGSIVLTLRFNRVHKSQLTSRQLSRTDNFLSFFK